ncbi:MAG: sensor histidine kinase [Pseudohongiellaceae bacterium]
MTPMLSDKPSPGTTTEGRDDEARVDSHLLTASGVLAIALVAYVSLREFGLWPQLVPFIGFAAIFVWLANGERQGLNNRFEVIGIFSLFGLSVWTWFLTPTDIVLILTIVMMAEAPYVISKRQSWLLMLVTNAAFWIVFTFYWNSQGLFLTWISMFALQAFALTSSLARVKESQLKQQLFAQNVELVAARSALAVKSQMEERLRIAGDLHDSIGHQLTALRLQLEALAQLAPQELKPRVEMSQQLSLDLLENIRSIVKRMSKDDPKDLAILIKQIDEETPGVYISLTGGVPATDDALNQALVPCIKEGLSNAIRHSGADQISIQFLDNSLVIEDNGSGLADGSQLGFGLKNIKQRLSPFGADIDLVNRETGGCCLTIAFAAGFITWTEQ